MTNRIRAKRIIGSIIIILLLRKSAERKIKSLQEKLDYANQERFGDRRQYVVGLKMNDCFGFQSVRVE